MYGNHSQKRVRRGFTLIELLVVVAIIALLISILLPSLSAAREAARTVACASIERQFGFANQMYADAENNYFVPVQDYGESFPNRFWPTNTKFRSMLGLPAVTRADLNHGDGFSHGGYPEGFACPSTTAERRAMGDVMHSYAKNIANHASRRGWVISMSPRIYVYHRPSIESPSAKVQMMDANEWRINLSNTNYLTNWEITGEMRPAQGGRKNVAYRHSDGLNIQHFDGHVEYYTQQEAWTFDPETDRKFWRILHEQ